jgi:hypothetical protein
MPLIVWSPLQTEQRMEQRAIDWAHDAFRDAFENPQSTPRWVVAILAPPETADELAA